MERTVMIGDTQMWMVVKGPEGAVTYSWFHGWNGGKAMGAFIGVHSRKKPEYLSDSDGDICMHCDNEFAWCDGRSGGAEKWFEEIKKGNMDEIWKKLEKEYFNAF